MSALTNNAQPKYETQFVILRLLSIQNLLLDLFLQTAREHIPDRNIADGCDYDKYEQQDEYAGYCDPASTPE